MLTVKKCTNRKCAAFLLPCVGSTRCPICSQQLADTGMSAKMLESKSKTIQ